MQSSCISLNFLTKRRIGNIRRIKILKDEIGGIENENKQGECRTLYLGKHM